MVLVPQFYDGIVLSLRYYSMQYHSITMQLMAQWFEISSHYICGECFGLQTTENKTDCGLKIQTFKIILYKTMEVGLSGAS